ncbi:hypothetical protein SAMN04488700_0614 [Carnobacterium iners]|uniref:Uncharacterized protein n=1 Tax=Carnobacterium iners TaxID=1073423 RepID=A0A1X7MR83_9LACT|nr:hypothetical protein [Carnobacterium iners]SEL14722.1 hypothetical protein SAMN04488114_13013 [Carnobacterium iners]SMH27332.1 hypothetical protein SAMN04488700_0614 [Carnobacterium iners]
MDQQKQLYSLAKQLYKENFWNDYLKTDLIAIQLANRKEPVIISVLGQTDHNYGFLFYRNLEELACFFEATIRAKQQNFRAMPDVIQLQNCLSLEFEDRGAISEEEYRLIKDSGVPFRGKKSWPIFVDYFPGYYPSIMDESDNLLIIEVIGKLIETAKDFKKKLVLDKDKKHPSEIPIRTYQKNDTYTDGLFRLPKKIMEGTSQFKKTAPILLTSFEMKRVNSQKLGSGIWEIDIDFMSSPVVSIEGERPFFPLALLIVDSEESEIICSEFFKPGDSETIQRLLIQLILSENKKPPKIVVSTNQYCRVARYLENLLLNLEIELVPIQKLPMISAFKKGLLDYL